MSPMYLEKFHFTKKVLLLLLLFINFGAGFQDTSNEIKDNKREKFSLIEKISTRKYSISKTFKPRANIAPKQRVNEDIKIEKEENLRSKRNLGDYFEDEFMDGGVNPLNYAPDIMSAVGMPGFEQNHETQPDFDISDNRIIPDRPVVESQDLYQTDLESILEENLVPPDQNDQPPTDPQHTPPQFMLDLFARFENDPFTQPASNIVRSFFNQVGKKGSTAADPPKCNTGSCTRKHKLWFDISSIPDDEHVTMAELRLYKFVEHDRRKFFGIHRKVDVFEIKKSKDLLNDHEERLLLDSKRIIGRTSGWETFYITNAVRRWVDHKAKKIHKLEVFIETIAHNDTSDIEFEEHPMSTNEPLLIVFSDSSEPSLTPTINQMAPYKSKLNRNQHDRDRRSIKPSKKSTFQSKMADVIRKKIQESGSKKRVRRSSNNLPCHKENMYVDFSKIGFKESLIVTPSGYPAGKCVGTCTIPFDGNNVTPYATIKVFMHLANPTSTPKPCCVPISLGPISLLYYEDGALVYQYRYKDMRVLECGCR